MTRLSQSSRFGEKLEGQVFLLGVSCDLVAGQLASGTMVYTTSLSDEARLQAAGVNARYVYRHAKTFKAASKLALDWLTTIRNRANGMGGVAAALFGDTNEPVWAMSYDALFEIRGGIFDCILHALLARDLTGDRVGQVYIIARPDNIMARALQQQLGDRATPIWHTELTDELPDTKISTVRRLAKLINSLFVHRALLSLRRLAHRPAEKRTALVGVSGDMAKLRIDQSGRLRLSDIYYENLESAIEAVNPDLVTAGLSSPRLGPSRFGSVTRLWRMILSGTYSPWYGYASFNSSVALVFDRRRYRALLQAAGKDPVFQSLFAVETVSFYRLVKPMLSKMLPGLLASARFHASVAERFVTSESIDRVISVESFSNLGRCMAAALHRHGGELWGIQGGIISPERVTNSGFYAPALGGQDHLQADQFFAWGPDYCDLLSTFKIDRARLQVMGFNRAKTGSLSVADQSPRKILYLTGANAVVCPYLMSVEEEDYTLQALVSCLPVDSELVIRVHPRQDAQALRDRFADRRVRVQSSANVPLEESLQTASLVVAKASTVLLEASSAGKPVLVVNLAGTPDFTGFSTGAAPLPYCTEIASLNTALSSLLERPENGASLSRFVQAWCSGTADAAANNLVAALTADRRR